MEGSWKKYLKWSEEQHECKEEIDKFQKDNENVRKRNERIKGGQKGSQVKVEYWKTVVDGRE